MDDPLLLAPSGTREDPPIANRVCLRWTRSLPRGIRWCADTRSWSRWAAAEAAGAEFICLPKVDRPRAVNAPSNERMFARCLQPRWLGEVAGRPFGYRTRISAAS